jgi:hypothetical protein
MARRLPPGIRRSVQRQATNVLETGRRFKRFDQLRQRHFWSTYLFLPDANGYFSSGTFNVFVTPPGQNGQGFPSGAVITERESNWKSQNRVPDNQNFEVTELGVSVGIATPSMDPQDTSFGSLAVNPAAVNTWGKQLSNFLNNTVLSITYLTNSVPLGMCADFAQASSPGMGVWSSGAALGSSNGVQYRSNGFAAPGLRRRLKIPILLQHGETFAFAFEMPRSYFMGALDDTNSVIAARMDFWATESFVEKS